MAEGHVCGGIIPRKFLKFETQKYYLLHSDTDRLLMFYLVLKLLATLILQTYTATTIITLIRSILIDISSGSVFLSIYSQCDQSLKNPDRECAMQYLYL
jgi:hypothetical protein